MIQVLLDALLTAAVVAPAAVGLTVTWALLGFGNFAVGSVMTAGAFAAWWLNGAAGLPVAAAAMGAALLTAVLTLGADRLVFHPLRGGPPWAFLLSSVALSFVVENALRFAFGGAVRAYDLPLLRPVTLLGARVTPDLLFGLAAAAAAVGAALLLLRATPWGRLVRATAEDARLAATRGLPVGAVRAGVVGAAGALAGLSGVIAGLSLAIEPGLGWGLTVPVIAAALLGGIGSAGGAVLGAVLVALGEEAAVRLLSPGYRPAVGFLLLVLVLLLRPTGLLGARIAAGRDR